MDLKSANNARQEEEAQEEEQQEAAKATDKEQYVTHRYLTFTMRV